ncbi:hypothetical protein WS65_28110 [Burkholderia anthina]|nr:hypothetical protein WS65_28110 [Burkholderia anthina]
MLTKDGPIRIERPRDRDGSFEPILIPKQEHAVDDERSNPNDSAGMLADATSDEPGTRAGSSHYRCPG